MSLIQLIFPGNLWGLYKNALYSLAEDIKNRYVGRAELGST